MNFEELIDVEEAITSVTSATPSRRKRMDDDALSDLFGIGTTQAPPTKTPLKKPRSITSSFPAKLTGELILKKRLAMKCSKQAFAARVGVSTATISSWEAKNKTELKPNTNSLNKLKQIWEETP